MTEGAAFKDHFSSKAADYAAFRPTYPRALVDFLAERAPARNLALDCGCGNGQFSVLLAERFARVVATDASAKQIAHAISHTSVEYRTAPAERTGLPDGCAALITVAQAVHWFDLDAFYREARRVARPDAIVALFAYDLMTIDRNDCTRTVHRFQNEDVGRYWPPERKLVSNKYRDLRFPFEEIPSPQFTMDVDWSLDALIGYIDTWSSVRNATKALGHDPVPGLRAELAQIWGAPDLKRRVTWPIILKVGRV